MKKVTVSAAQWKAPRDVHQTLKEALGFPDFYGNNLDALHDCLTDMKDVCIIIENCAQGAENMGDYWGRLLTVLLDSCSENSTLDIQLVQGNGDYE